MERLTSSELRDFAAVAEEISGLGEPGSLPRTVLSAARRLVACDTASYNLIDLRRKQNQIVWTPDEARPTELMANFERHIHEHPVVLHQTRTRNGGAAKLSDFVSQDEYHRLDLYTDAYVLVGVEHQIAVSLVVGPGALLGVALSRDRLDFNERDRTVLNLLKPFIAQAFRHDQMLDLLRRGVNDDDRELILIDQTGRTMSVSDRAWGWLAEFAGVDGRIVARLPEPINGWARHCQLRQFETDPTPSPPYVFTRGDQRLAARFTRGGIGLAFDLVVLELRRTPREARPHPRLSPRENQILAQAALGGTNEEIGVRLEISERTVEKHVAHIRAKLGVRTRAAMVAAALTGDDERRAEPADHRG